MKTMLVRKLQVGTLCKISSELSQIVGRGGERELVLVPHESHAGEKIADWNSMQDFLKLLVQHTHLPTLIGWVQTKGVGSSS